MMDIIFVALIVIAFLAGALFIIIRTVLFLFDGRWQVVFWHDCGWMGDIMSYDISVCPGCGQCNPIYTRGPAKRRWLWGWKTK